MSKFKVEKKERFNVAMRPSVHNKARDHANKKGMSLSAFIDSLIVLFFCKDK
jgi:predicted HicB family RNase H-like nuclease